MTATGPDDADDQARHPQQPAEGDRDEVEAALQADADDDQETAPTRGADEASDTG